MSQGIEVKAVTKVVMCPLCGYLGDDAGKVFDSLRNATPTPVLKCPKCGVEVRSEEFATHLRKHARIGGKTWTCDICGAKLNGEGAFLRHVKEHLLLSVRRGGLTVYYCLVCGQEFITKNSALAHIRSKHEAE
ncbi:C2H2-type zinc finger protein [Vulcanisaeta thermophila]|uniref:C2H2-type zinc finger protein n=1 Tax=Vulcanisaeta thermophila TaxID=867917 RepID=UPI001EE1F0A2|nr:C2H2-type zinc finger protein [Vulcanisaeta thermophila]